MTALRPHAFLRLLDAFFEHHTGSTWDHIRKDPRRLAALRARRSRAIGLRRPEREAARTGVTIRVEPALPPSAPGVFSVTREVYEAIRRTVGRLPAETGGALGGTYEEGVVTEFVFDAEAKRTGGTYSPNTGFLNPLFKEDWTPRGVRFLGFVHSHPTGFRRPSQGDRVYAARILAKIDELPYLFLPLVMSKADGGRFELLPFVALRDGHGGVRIEPAELGIVERNVRQTAPLHRDLLPARRTNTAPLFERVEGAYDLALLRGVRVVFVGVGGARAFGDDLVRAGIEEFVLIDGDTVSASNVATQHVRYAEIGRSKVDCVADHLREINPNVRVRTVARMLDDGLDDADLERLVASPFEGYAAPRQILLGGFTDNFHAQARLHRFALTTGRSYIAAQVYREGRGIELTFVHPDTTPACCRCALRGRYVSYESGYENAVGSAGTPISATTQLNALKGYLTFALLHHGSDHPRWGGLLAEIGNRNLVLMRLDPDLAETVGVRQFDEYLGENERLCFGETLWLPQKPDHPDNGYSTCPECGGQGDLRRVVGTIPDTRPTMPYGLEERSSDRAPSTSRRFPLGPLHRPRLPRRP